MIAALLAVTGGLLIRDALRVWSDLRTGERILARARDVARSGDIDRLSALLSRARAPLVRADRRARGPVWRVAGTVPLAGRSARAARDIARASVLALDAAEAAVGAFRELPTKRGRLSYSIRGSRLDLGPWRRARPSLSLAVTRVGEASRILARAPASRVLGPVARARRRLTSALDELERMMSRAHAASVVVPSMLGAESPRRYALVVVNPAEARAGGGLVGGYAIVDARRGRLSLLRSGVNAELRDAREPVPVPSWVRERYGRFGIDRDWSNVTMEPDLRVSGPIIAALLRRTTGEWVDGVILLDVHALAHILEVTGTVEGPGGTILRAETFARLAMSEAYTRFGERSAERKRFLAEAATRIWERLLRSSPVRAGADALGASARSRHLGVWSSREDERDALHLLGLDGAFVPDRGEFVGVVTQNASGNKVDYYVRREIDVRIRLAPDGSAHGMMDVVLRNRAPRQGLPSEVLGPFPALPEDAPGWLRTYLSVYLPPDAVVLGVRQGTSPVRFESDGVPGARVASSHITVPAGGAATVRVEWRVARAFDPRAGARYGLTVLRQPTAAPDLVRIRISPPPGVRALPEPGASGRSRDSFVWRVTADEDVEASLALSSAPSRDELLELPGRAA